jgi:hypothetical protein
MTQGDTGGYGGIPGAATHQDDAPQLAALYPSGEAATMTVEQRHALAKVAERWHLVEPITVHPCFGGDGALMVKVANMWLGIEPDGYTHS